MTDLWVLLLCFLLLTQLEVDAYSTTRTASRGTLLQRSGRYRILRVYSSSFPKSSKEEYLGKTARASGALIRQLALAGLLQKVSKAEKANAIGSMNELAGQDYVLQDIAFNVQDVKNEVETFSALFQETSKAIRLSESREESVAVVAFGADAYDNPPSFFPGVSSFLEGGAHATVTIQSKKLAGDGGVVELFEKGNGLQFVKIGTELLRLSKGMAKGADVGYGYGYVELNTADGIPLEIVLGIARDPLMLAALRVTSMKDTVQFCTDTLKMKKLPFPLARSPGSEFEPLPPKDAVYMGYSADTMGLLLLPANVLQVDVGVNGRKKMETPPVVVGTQLDRFTIVYDDAKVGGGGGGSGELSGASSTSAGTATETVYSPDGYPFVFKPYSEFKKIATKTVPLPP